MLLSELIYKQTPKVKFPILNVSVLATLVKNKLVPDPFYGLENKSIIDIEDSGREYYTFWFFTTFTCKVVSGRCA